LVPSPRHDDHDQNSGLTAWDLLPFCVTGVDTVDAGTLFGAFGYVGFFFQWFFPESEDDTPREYMPPWIQLAQAVKSFGALEDGGKEPKDASVDEMQANPMAEPEGARDT
jgi:hypothetical protein